MTLSPQSATLMASARRHRTAAGLVSDYGNGHVVYHATHAQKRFRDAQVDAHRALMAGKITETERLLTLQRLRTAAKESVK